MWNKCSVSISGGVGMKGVQHSLLIGLRKHPSLHCVQKACVNGSMLTSIPMMAHTKRVNLLFQLSGLEQGASSR